MSDTPTRIDYPQLVERAMVHVMRAALEQAAEHGLPGDHHFYITFRSQHPGVVMADDLRARYPNEMTIVLQHEYWSLEVDDQGFAITLRFGGTPSRLEIPYGAITIFADPAVNFGLQFAAATVPAGEDAPDSVAEEAGAEVETLPSAPPREAPAARGEGADIVPLDTFRKK